MVRIQELSAGRYWQHLNMSLEPVSNGHVGVSMEITDELINYYGNVHGGAIASLMDTCIGVAINQQVPIEQGSSTVEMKLNYIRPASKGILHGQASVVHKGRNIVVAYGEIMDDAGAIVAFGTATFMLSNTDK